MFYNNIFHVMQHKPERNYCIYGRLEKNVGVHLE